MWNISFCCRVAKVTKDGLAPIELVITVDGQRSFKRLSMKVSPEEFKRSITCKRDNYVKQYCDKERVKTYEIFSGEELKIAEKIQRRRYQMLVHSYIYYVLDKNILTDNQWSQWAMELAELQRAHPGIAKKVMYARDFADWDGSSGAYLKYADKPNIVSTANRLLRDKEVKTAKPTSAPVRKPLINKPSSPKKKLFRKQAQRHKNSGRNF